MQGCDTPSSCQIDIHLVLLQHRQSFQAACTAARPTSVIQDAHELGVKTTFSLLYWSTFCMTGMLFIFKLPGLQRALSQL